MQVLLICQLLPEGALHVRPKRVLRNLYTNTLTKIILQRQVQICGYSTEHPITPFRNFAILQNSTWMVFIKKGVSVCLIFLCVVLHYRARSIGWKDIEQECIPVGCVLPACWLYPSMHWAGKGMCIPSQHALSRGVYPSMHWPGGCLTVCPGGSAQGGVWQTPPCGQTDTCENITFANFICGR